MSSRPQFDPYPVIVNGDMSADIVSKPTIISKLSMISYDIAWSGTAPLGTFSVEVSNSYSQNADGSVRNAGNWSTVPTGAPSTSSQNIGNGMIDIEASGCYAARLRYTHASGTGSLNVIVSGKVS